MRSLHANLIVTIIPAFNPPDTFSELVAQLLQRVDCNVVIVDDGTTTDAKLVFASLSSDRVTILTHAVNLGKGAALKTGINFALARFGREATILTLDADGQHLISDLESVAETSRRSPTALVLGTRMLSFGETPLRSYIGNKFTRIAVSALIGCSISDTQTGLRAIPGYFATGLLRLPSNGYEFELQMLIAAQHGRVPILEQPISTVYSNGNSTSHFRPLLDSARIYSVLIRFLAVSLLSAVADNIVFYFLCTASIGVMGAQIISRLLIAPLNLLMLREFAFYSSIGYRALLPRYLLVVALFFCISSSFISARNSLGFSSMESKLLIESLLFFANFIIQRDYVFANQSGVKHLAREN